MIILKPDESPLVYVFIKSKRTLTAGLFLSNSINSISYLRGSTIAAVPWSIIEKAQLGTENDFQKFCQGDLLWEE